MRCTPPAARAVKIHEAPVDNGAEGVVRERLIKKLREGGTKITHGSDLRALVRWRSDVSSVRRMTGGLGTRTRGEDA